MGPSLAGNYHGGSMVEQPLRVLQHLLVCPVCKGKLAFSAGLIRCSSCNLRFLQSRDDFLDLLPGHLLDNKGERWRERQQEMEEWYKDLIANPTVAKNCFVRDYAPYASLLATLSGDVLDVGGGGGIVREYLNNVQYTVIDPSLDWLGAEWSSLAKRFPSLETKLRFVRGVGEYLPFPAQVFDAVLAFWTLNHVSYPEEVFSEVHRVLRPGGRFLVVLEDMPPSWGDIASGAFPASRVAPGGGDPNLDNPAHPSGQEWPLQSDHIRIRESDIQTWTSRRFEVVRREWIDQYLTFEFRAIKPLPDGQTGMKNTTKTQQSENHIRALQNQRREFVQQLQALEEQLKYRQDLYNKVVNEIRTRVRVREWKKALQCLLGLLQHYLRR